MAPLNEDDENPLAKKPKLEKIKTFEHGNLSLNEEDDENPPAKKPKLEKIKTFEHGNYNRYYGYRNLKNFQDVRLDVLKPHRDLFEKKLALDIGCNNGLLTISLAKEFDCDTIVGIDIDKKLIGNARKILKCHLKHDLKLMNCKVTFEQGDYILKDEALLELEQEQFDVITCFSVTKWIHLNSGDAGLKLLFRRVFKQLRPGGAFILEPQQWKGYKKRKNISGTTLTNYENIKMRPDKFTEYLLSNEIGFKEALHLGVSNHSVKGFRRPITIYLKATSNDSLM